MFEMTEKYSVWFEPAVYGSPWMWMVDALKVPFPGRTIRMVREKTIVIVQRRKNILDGLASIGVRERV
jgi:hypothetical protein